MKVDDVIVENHSLVPRRQTKVRSNMELHWAISTETNSTNNYYQFISLLTVWASEGVVIHYE